MENHERMERELLEQCDQVVTLVECDCECIERLEELCRVKRPRFIGHRQSMVARIARIAGAKTQLERRFVHVGDEREWRTREEQRKIFRLERDRRRVREF